MQPFGAENETRALLKVDRARASKRDYFIVSVLSCHHLGVFDLTTADLSLSLGVSWRGVDRYRPRVGAVDDAPSTDRSAVAGGRFFSFLLFQSRLRSKRHRQEAAELDRTSTLSPYQRRQMRRRFFSISAGGRPLNVASSFPRFHFRKKNWVLISPAVHRRS